MNFKTKEEWAHELTVRYKGNSAFKSDLLYAFDDVEEATRVEEAIRLDRPLTAPTAQGDTVPAEYVNDGGDDAFPAYDKRVPPTAPEAVEVPALLPCPFCNVTPSFERRPEPDRIHIWCDNNECLASVHINWLDGSPVKTAIEYWNGATKRYEMEAD